MSASPVSGGLLGPVAKPVLPDTDLVPTADGGGGDESECLRVQIYQVRKNIEPNPSTPKFIQTGTRLGYRFEPNAAAFCPPKVKTGRKGAGIAPARRRVHRSRQEGLDARRAARSLGLVLEVASAASSAHGQSR